MGIDINIFKFMASARMSGVDFRRTIMIGRQKLYVPRDQVDRVLPPRSAASSAVDERYGEWVLHRLGADKVDSLDVSDYENASILHDMNTPLPIHLHGQYTMELEFWTLEHLFNFPVAIRNCMELVAVGGHLICYTVANNFCGHGFYQFSPELFYRVLSPENGFSVDRMVACDAFRESDWYRVSDPAQTRRRVQISGPYPVMLIVQARRVASITPFAKPPQQSDYVAVWTGQAEKHADHADPIRPGRRGLAGLLRWLTPGPVLRKVRDIRSARQYPPGAFSIEPAIGSVKADDVAR